MILSAFKNTGCTDLRLTQYLICFHSATVLLSFNDRDPKPLRVLPRGNAGVAILWRKDDTKFILELLDGSERVLAVRFLSTSGHPVILVNTYMPANGTLSGDSYRIVLDEIHEIYAKYSGHHTIIWIGDMNASQVRITKNPND